MRFLAAALILTLALIVVLTGCNGSSSSVTSNQQADTSNSDSASVFVTSLPSDSVALITAKATAQPGDTVVFEARVGGRRDPFVENRAIFFVVDPSLLSCDQMQGDTCKTPWDYCCEPPRNLLKHMATVQVVDDAGQPLKIPLRNQNGLDTLKTVYVTGTVQQADESGNFVVNADSIHVKKG